MARPPGLVHGLAGLSADVPGSPLLAASMVGSRPAIPLEELARRLHDAWGIAGVLQPLPSERDQNVRVDVDGTPRWVAKVANPAEQPAFLDAQDAVLGRLADAGLPVARSIPPRTGGARVWEPTPHGPARIRVVPWLGGRPLAILGARPPELPRRIGELMGRVTAALAGFEHRGADRPFQWDLLRAVETVERGVRDVSDAGRRGRLERRLERLRAIQPRVAALRRSVIHNDANDHNLLVDDDGRVTGLLDLGDMVRSVTAAELAVAQTYAMLDQPDPLAVAAQVAAGFDAHVERTPQERDLERDLILARLAVSAATSAHQATLDPDPYLRISEAPVWRLLERLDDGT